MIKTRVIPCLDVMNGRVVKGVQFVDLRDAGDPVACARAYDEAGADEVCFLDISATSDGRKTLLSMVECTADACNVPLTVGGGVRTLSDIRDLMLAGADKVSVNSAAVNRPSLVEEAAGKFGSQAIVVALDVRRFVASEVAADGGQDFLPDWRLYSHGGRQDTGVNAIEFSRRITALGCGEILLTSMDRDGTKSGFDLDLIRAVTSEVNVPVIASGGAGNARDMVLAVREARASAVLAASIFHFGEISIDDVKRAMADAGIPVRRDPVIVPECN